MWARRNMASPPRQADPSGAAVGRTVSDVAAYSADGRLIRVYFETAFSFARAWSIWSYAYVAMAAVVIVSPSRASDS